MPRIDVLLQVYILNGCCTFADIQVIAISMSCTTSTIMRDVDVATNSKHLGRRNARRRLICMETVIAKQHFVNMEQRSQNYSLILWIGPIDDLS